MTTEDELFEVRLLLSVEQALNITNKELISGLEEENKKLKGEIEFYESLDYGDSFEKIREEHKNNQLSPKEGFIFECARHALDLLSKEIK